MAFFYIYDHETGQVIEWNAIQPLGHKTYLDEQPLFNQSYFSKSPYQFDIQHANGVRYIQSLNMVRFNLALVFLCWNRYIKFVYTNWHQWLDLYPKADHIG